ncbi:MAG: acyl-CoA dehydrogenase family protein [Ilumatobacteraceae bacterium]
MREQMETEAGYDQAVWSQMGEQMGLQGLAIPEEFGGSATASSSSASCWRRWVGRCSALRTSPPWCSPPTP